MKKRFLSVILSAVVAVTMFLHVTGCAHEQEPIVNDSVVEETSLEEPITIIACSDYQNPNGNVASRTQVKRILSKIKDAGYTRVDGFLCAGDYDYEYEETAEGIQSLKETVQASYESLVGERMVFVQGNHDFDFAEGMARSGANDTREYGVYVIHEDEYPANGGHILGTQRVAADLEDYLREKVEHKNSRPIFVISHVPLHYSIRTYKEGAALYGEYIFDVLNKYAKEGQNIIYLYGHNHNSWGYDDYLGGSSVFLTKGDTLYVSQPDQQTEVPIAKELHFTYMNAGYTGYSCSANDCADKTLSMTVFQIEKGVVIIERYSSMGVCDLKAKGVWSDYSSETAKTYGADDSYLDKVYASPQVIEEK